MSARTGAAAGSQAIVAVDPGSAHFPALVDLRNALERESVGESAVGRTAAVVRLGWQGPTHRSAAFVVLAGGSGQPVGMAVAGLDQADNAHLLDVELYVAPEHRRRGHGRALLDALRRLARAEGRDTLLWYTARRPGAGMAWSLHEAAVADPGLTRSLDPGDGPGVGFTRAAGLAQVQTELRTEVRLPHDERLVAAAEAEASRHAAGYRTVTWLERPPPELLGDRAGLAERMSTDPPLGGIDYRAESWDVDRVTATYDDHLRRGGTVVGAGAVEERSGRLVAFSEVVVDPGLGSLVPGLGPPTLQMDTLVLAEHRGRRLGMVVKAANLRAVSATFPDVGRVVTWNAIENGPMLRVNRAIGFEPVALYAVWQGKL